MIKTIMIVGLCNNLNLKKYITLNYSKYDK